ncbi:MAG TPA: DUF309 domain-containing protein [Candidatus Limnocylindrales bacterium]|nr:DUF309 domain-containing protein [Candidatus Limnocylindrales bacterium]
MTRHNAANPTPDERILQGGRAKAYRPLPPAARREAFEAGLAAYANDDFFEAHERWEPAWMGTRDLSERELIQGLIKLAAAFVHQARGNPAGIEKNLRGARERIEAGTSAGPALGIDARALLETIDAWFAAPVGPPMPIPRITRPNT